MEEERPENVEDLLREEGTKLFNIVRPVNVQIVDALEKGNLDSFNELIPKLQKIVNEQPVLGVIKCFSYILFPALSILKSSNSKNLENSGKVNLNGKQRDNILELIRVVLERCGSQSLFPNYLSREQFLDIIQQIAILIQISQISSEESKISISHIFYRCFAHSSSVYIFQLCEIPSFTNMIAFIITTLVDYFSKEKNRELKITSIQAIGEIFKKITHKFGAAILPGIITPLSKVITGDFKQGHKVLVAALDVFTNIIVKIFNDSVNANVLKNGNDNGDPLASIRSFNKSKKDERKFSEEEEIHSPINRPLDEKWMKETSEKIKIILERVFSITKEHSFHPKWKVRLASVTATGMIATECKETLNASIPLLIDSIVLHIRDDNLTVAQETKRYLHQLSSQLSYNTLSIVKENLYNAFMNLPKHVRRYQDQEILTSIRLVIGHICLLGSSSEMITFLQSSFQRISLALLQCLEFDIYDVRKVEEKSQKVKKGISITSDIPINEEITSLSTQVESKYPQKTFKYFRSEQVSNGLSKICKLIGYYGDASSVLDGFFAILKDSENARYHKQAIFAMNEIILGMAKIGIEEELEGLDIIANSKTNIQTNFNPSNLVTIAESRMNENLADLILDVYFSEFLWNVPTQSSNQIKLTIEEQQSNVLLQSLLLEGIGSIAESMGVKFDTVLPKTLYNVTEKLGDNSSIISQSAWATLQKISKVLQYENVTKLISMNTDYLIDTIIHHLKYLQEYPLTPQLLKGILQYADEGIIPLLEETLNSVFASLDRNSTNSIAISFLSILHNIVIVLGKKAKENPPIPIEKSESTTEEEVSKELSKPPFLVDIVLKMQHFLGSKSRELILLAFEVIIDGIPAISVAHNERLLNVIHLLWQAIRPRFNEQEKVIFIKVMKVIQVMALFGKDFISQRFTEELWPSLKKQFEGMKNEGQLRNMNEDKYSLAFKQKHSILQCLVTVSKNIHVNHLLMVDMMESVKIFLRDKQPIELKNETMELIKVFMTIDSDSVWFMLHQLQGSVFRKGNRPDVFENISLLTSISEHKQFTECSRILLENLAQLSTNKT